MLQKYEEALWFCRKCKQGVKQSSQKIKQLEQQNKELQDKVDRLEKKVDSERQDIVQEITDKVMDHIKEQEDSKRRRTNLVLYNIAESQKETTSERTA